MSGQLAGVSTKDPAFGLPAVWIDATLREQAHVFGYTVVDASTVVATHLNHVILSHATELLGRQETQALLDHLTSESPKLVEDLVPKLLPLGVLQRVLQNLLEESVNIRDMRTIIEPGTESETSDVIVIGDTPKDIACAAALGARCLAVATGAFQSSELRSYGAWQCVDSFEDIQGIHSLVSA